MSELFRAEVLEVGTRSARIALTMASAEATRFWNTKTFGLWLLLEPIMLGSAAAGAVAEVVPPDAIRSWDLARLRACASKVVTAVAIESVTPSVPDHQARLRALQSPDELERYFESGEAPRATFLLKLKSPGAADHLKPGMRWRSAACDMG